MFIEKEHQLRIILEWNGNNFIKFYYKVRLSDKYMNSNNRSIVENK